MVRIGWKVGATSKKAQLLLGASGPATAPLLDGLYYRESTTVSILPSQNTSVEAEFAFRFSKGLPSRQSSYDRDEVIGSIESVMPAVEIVACRFTGGFSKMGQVSLISDSVANVGLVSGRESVWLKQDVINQSVILRQNGKVVAKGSGKEVLGDPINVLVWTVNHLSRLGTGIMAGEIVSTGTCTGVISVDPGDIIVADFGCLHSVEVSFK